MIYRILNICLFFFAFASNAHALVKEEFSQEKILNLTEDIRQTYDDSSLPPSIKLHKILNELSQLKGHTSSESFSETFRNVEPLLFQSYTDPKDREKIFYYITLNVSFHDWPFSKSREEVFAYLDSLVSDVSPELKALHSIQKFNIYELKNNNTEAYSELNKATEEAKAFPKSPSIWSDINSFFNFAINEKKLSYARDIGNIDEARNLSHALDVDFEKMIRITSNVLQYEQTRFDFSNDAENTYRVNQLLIESIDYDEFLGKNDQALRKSKLLLARLDPYTNNKFLMLARADVLTKMGMAYAKINDMEAMKKALKESIQFQIRSGDINSKYLIDFVYLNIRSNQKTLADFYINALENQLNKLDHDDQLFYKGLIPTLREYNEIRSLEPVDKSAVDKIYYHKIAEWQERVYFQLVATRPTRGLDLIYGIYKNFYNANDKDMSAVYAKLYINTLQRVRAGLTQINDPSLVTFTEVNSDRIKEFSNLFFEISDFESSFKCFQIIKENEFLDFVRRKDVSEHFLTSIDLSKQENDYMLKISVLYGQIDSIEKQLNKNNTPEQKKLLLDGLTKSKSELDAIKGSLNNYFKQTTENNKSNRISKFHRVNKLEGHEAFLEVFTMSNSVSSRIYTNEKISDTFTSKINSLEFRNSILKIYNAFSKKQPAPSADIDLVSKSILDQPLAFVSNDQITTLKVRINDFYLNLIPISQLHFNKKDLGQLYTINMVGLDSHLTAASNENGIINAFAATKGNNRFTNLPGAKKEIDALRSISTEHEPNHNEFYVDNDFNRANFMSSFIKGTDLIHVATHFQSSGNTSGTTRMLLGDGSEMSLEDLRYELPALGTKLITLSACDTASIIPKNGQQEMSGTSYFEGLSTTFQTKGARNVIATLWSIDDDATSDFMGIFYSILMSTNVSPSEALHLTQNVFRLQSLSALPSNMPLKQRAALDRFTKKLSKYSDPYYWAAFQLYSIN